MIVDLNSKKVRAMGRVNKGLYYLVNDTDQEGDRQMKCLQAETQLVLVLSNLLE